MTIDGLAVLVAEGFENTATKDDVGRLDRRMDSFEGIMGSLEHGQEDIKLKLDNVAYRFELVELQRRVALLEKRDGLRR